MGLNLKKKFFPIPLYKKKYQNYILKIIITYFINTNNMFKKSTFPSLFFYVEKNKIK